VRFLIDQQLPPVLLAWLQSRGQIAEHVRNIGLREASDARIWETARQTDAVILTKDEDFMLRRSVTDGPQILWLRVGNVTNAALLSRMNEAWPDVYDLLRQGEPIVEIR